MALPDNAVTVTEIPGAGDTGCAGSRRKQQTGLGRPKSLSKDKQALAVRLYDERKHTVTQICEIMGISKPTLYKYIAAARAG
ncbi:helix-turn-helix domain-containing protein [Escherichia coli]|uniref:helix-turn-helix domain-containing protein n=1 Tax=Escherichia coli TaxID=562 RepID=UPI00201D243A|nr:helix-turn-helix domain-containing protein [Escherichia coli]